MITLNIPDMSCAHCVGVITKAIKALDGDAVLDFTLPERMVQVQTTVDSATLLATLDEAGYPATPR